MVRVSSITHSQIDLFETVHVSLKKIYNKLAKIIKNYYN